MRKPGSKVRLIMRSPCTSRMREAAKPPISACRTLAGSAPALEANSKASPTASIVSATMIWLATLVVWPAPTSPTSVMFLPINSKSGLTRLNAASEPPTMIVSEAALAPTSPPDTGASAYPQPFWTSSAATTLLSVGDAEPDNTDFHDASPLIVRRWGSLVDRGTVLHLWRGSQADRRNKPHQNRVRRC